MVTPDRAYPTGIAERTTPLSAELQKLLEEARTKVDGHSEERKTRR